MVSGLTCFSPDILYLGKMHKSNVYVLIFIVIISMLLKHFEEKKREKKRKREDNETRERQRCGGAFVKQRGHPTFCSQFDTQV